MKNLRKRGFLFIFTFSPSSLFSYLILHFLHFPSQTSCLNYSVCLSLLLLGSFPSPTLLPPSLIFSICSSFFLFLLFSLLPYTSLFSQILPFSLSAFLHHSLTPLIFLLLLFAFPISSPPLSPTASLFIPSL